MSHMLCQTLLILATACFFTKSSKLFIASECRTGGFLLERVHLGPQALVVFCCVCAAAVKFSLIQPS